MADRNRERRWARWSGALLVSATLAPWGISRGQEPIPVPPLPGVEDAAAAAEVPGTREAELEARIQQLESMVRQLSTKLEAVATPPAPGPAAAAAAGAGGGPGGATNAAGSAVPGDGAPASRAPKVSMPAPKSSLSLKGSFSNGFQLGTEDDEYQLQFHNLTQIDYRGYNDTPNAPLNNVYHSTFGIPRQWWIFSGRLTKSIEYSAVPAFGFDGVNLLDAFINYRAVDDRLQFKVGRYKTPFTYEFYNGPINGLINPERSLFFNNFALNREIGAMAWGQLLDKRLDYAAGVFNNDRNGYTNRTSSPTLAAYLNFRPFEKLNDSALQFLNIGGSVYAGNTLQRPVPQTLRTNVATTGNSFFGVPFFRFNDDIVDSGGLAFWDLHAAWYYKSLSLIAEWSSGVENYAKLDSPQFRTRLPIQGYYVQAGYFLTGETVSARGAVKPIRNFSLKAGQRGPGAWELATRWSTLDLGKQAFTEGLADPNLWSRHADLLDVGVNWYLTQQLKVYLGWQHSAFGSPVLLDPNRYQLTNDMYWVRFQIYF